MNERFTLDGMFAEVLRLNDLVGKIADALTRIADANAPTAAVTDAPGQTLDESTNPPKPKSRARTKTSEPQAPEVSHEQIRTALSALAGSGRDAEVRALLRRHGADRLSETATTEYAAMLAEAEEITNGG
jgi:hypothetical protein